MQRFMQNLPVVMEIILIPPVIHKSRQKVETERKERARETARAREKNRGKLEAGRFQFSVLELEMARA